MNFELRKYKAEHWSDLMEMDADKIRSAVQFEKSAFAYSVFDNGVCIGCAGIMRTHGKVYYIWVVASKTLKEHRLWFHRTVRRYFKLWQSNLDWIRIEALVDADNQQECRWAWKLGFKIEGRKVKGGDNGRDAFVYAMVK